jgi:hypothetical protein
MSPLQVYREGFSNARLTRSKTGVFEVALHTNGGTPTNSSSACFTRSAPMSSGCRETPDALGTRL